MVGAVVQHGLQADERVAGEHALLHGVAQALFDGREEVFRHAAAKDFFFKDHVIGLVLRLKADPDVAELAAAAGLLLVAAVGLDLALDLLTVSDAGGLELGLDAEAALELGAQDVDLNVAGAGDDHLVGLGVVDEREGDVLLVQAGEAGSDLVVLALGLGADGHGVAGLCQLDGGQLDLVLRVADGVAGFPLHLADGHDVAAAGFLDLGVLLAAHGVHAAELIGAAHAHVAQRQIGRDLAGEHLDEGVLAELVGNGLEHERAHRAVRVDGELAAVSRGDLTDLGRVGHVIHDRLQHGLGADAAVSGAAEHGEHGAVLQTLTQALDGILLGEHHVLEVFLHEFLVRTGGRLKERLAQRLDHVGVGGGNGDLRGLVAIGLVSHVVHQIDDTGAVAHRRGHGADGAAVLFLQGGEDGGKIAVIFIRLGDVEHAGHVGIFEVFPAALSADGDAVFRSAEDYAGLDGAQGAHHVAREVEKARAVEHVDLAAAEVDRRDAGRDRDLALDLFGIVITDGVAVGRLALAVDRARHIQHALGECGLTAAAMAEQAHIADILGFVAHVVYSPYI